MNTFKIAANDQPVATQLRSSKGFSILELLIAMAVFLFVAGAAFSLFNRHLAFVTQQQRLSTLNIGMRNAMSQLELDLAAAGQNVFGNVQNGTPATAFSLGVIIRNSTPLAAGACVPNARWAYPTNKACFDSLTIIQPKNCPVLSLATSKNLTSGSLTANDTGANLALDAACYTNGDEVLIVSPPSTCDQGVAMTYCLGVVTLTQNGQVAGGQITLSTNPPGPFNDPIGVIYSGGGTNYTRAVAVAAGFNYPANSYIVDLGTGANDVTYAVQVSATDPNDDQLVRCAGATCTPANAQVLTDQVIGFKVGAILWDNYNDQTKATDDVNYFYDASAYCSDSINGADCSPTPPPANDPYDYSLIRAVRVSMVARTNPGSETLVLKNLRNGFDNGPYLVQQASVAVDLRSITNSDILN
jgi:prepilin-type N-terminal cleavage/methylation domain-containing protein